MEAAVMTEAPAAEMVETGSIKAWPANPRKNDGEPVTRVADSIRRFGFAAPIVARLETREIIAGHTRWKAAQMLKMTHVPVRFVDLSEREAHLLALADNRLGELAEWDTPELHTLLQQYDVGEQFVAGWNEKDMRELERFARAEGDIPEDEAPPLPKEPVTKLGDLWRLGDHRLVCGDATDPRVVSLARADLTALMMVTDPPYGVDYDPEWRKHTLGPDGKPLSKGYNGKRMGTVPSDDRSSWIEAWRLAAADIAYVYTGGLSSNVVANELDAVGYRRRSLIVWKKNRPIIGRGHYHWQHETCWYAVREGKTAQWTGDRTQSTLWEINFDGVREDTIHGTQKPVECMARPIRNHGKSGDVVYDPFCGSGTTLVAAQHLGRVCVAVELSPAYCDVIVERWQRLTGDKALRQG